MDIEELAPVEGEQPVNAPIEGEEAVEEEAQDLPTIEDYARQRGWKPKEEWDGEGEWRGADEFLDFGLDRTRTLATDLKELKETTSRMADTQARLTADQIEKARIEERNRWQDVHTKAVEEGDVEIANQAVDKIADLNNPKETTEPDPIVKKFVDENTWFTTDPIANAVAQAAASQAASTGATVDGQMKAAGDAVYKRFPEYAPKSMTPAKEIEVNKPERKVSQAKRAKTLADLPTEAQQAARALVERGVLKDTDGYVRQYFNKEGVIE